MSTSSTPGHSRIQGMQGRVQHAVHQATDSSKDFVVHHPMSTALVVFGLGMGLGVTLACLMSEGNSRRHEAGVAQRLGRRLLDAVAHAVPESLSRHR